MFYFWLTIKDTDESSLYNCAHQQPIVFSFQTERICSLIDPFITQPNEKHHDNTEGCFSACTSVDYKMAVYEQESSTNMLHWKQQSHKVPSKQ